MGGEKVKEPTVVQDPCPQEKLSEPTKEVGTEVRMGGKIMGGGYGR